MAGEFNIKKQTVGDMTNTVGNVSVDERQLDGVGASNETTWMVKNWSKWYGYFMEVPDLHSALLMKSIWNVGKGWTTDPATKVVLENVNGWGKDNFDDILFNLDLTSNICGDSFAEIIRDKQGILVNLKPLDPSTVKTIVNQQGIIIRYEQSTSQSPKNVKKFKPIEMFHLCKNRIGDQIHGISKIEALQKTIDAENESFTDMKKLMHFQVRPYILWKLKTDDPTKIRDAITKIEAAKKYGEDTYIPDDDDTISWEVVQVNPSAIVLAWRDDVRNKFYRGVGLPLIIFSSGGSSESGGKIEYLSHETVFAREQRFIEEQIWNQLALRITLNTPTTLLDNLQNDEAKDASQGLEVQPNDVTAASAI